MIYFVKHTRGIEIQVTKEIYDLHLGREDFECRLVDPRPVKQSPPVKVKAWPVKDEEGPWFTLSNGKRIKGKRNAEKEQAKL